MKKKILIFTDWFLPGHKAGGPIRSIANLSEFLAEYADVFIFTSNMDLGDQEAYPGIHSDQWTSTDLGYQVYYSSTKHLNYNRVKNVIHEIAPDLLYVNGIFSKKFSIFPLRVAAKQTKLKTLVAPRGMLGAGALSIKPFKKKIFLFIVKNIFKIFSSVEWQATSVQEKNEIIKCFGENIHVNIIPNLSSTVFNETYFYKNKEVGKLKLAFVSRISPKKNLEYALKILAEHKFDGEIQFDIFGPAEDQAYWSNCLELIKRMPVNIRVKYHGPIQNEKVVDELSKSHAFFFPTLNENFGHVIAESILAANVLLLSDQTPWRNLEKQNLGYDIPLNKPMEYVNAISQMLALDQSKFESKMKDLKIRAKQLAQQINEKKINKQYFIEA